MAVATKAFFDMTFDKTTTEAFLFGDTCSNVTGPMAEISRQWKMFQLSYGDTDPVLSDRDKYPNFFRIVPSDSDFNPARLALLRHFNWSIVGTLFQDASQGTARYGYAHNRFDSLMETHKINISQVDSFADDPHSAIQNLKARDVRIIVGNFDENKARKVFCSARQQGMYGPRHQWIILGTYSQDWWRHPDSSVPCSPAELNDTLDGYLATGILPLSTDEEATESGRTPQEYMQLYDAERGSEYSVYHGYAYDGIWVIARALEKLLAENGVRPNDNRSLEHWLRGEKVGQALNDTYIRGVTGRVQFNNGDRVGAINILQMQSGVLVKIAEYNAFTEQLDFTKGQPIYWRGGRVPLDRTIQHEEMRHVSTPMYLALVAVASTGIIMACCFLGLNIHFRSHRFIKMSSPNMNNVIIVGCILCYLSILLLGTDGSFASTSPVFFKYWCRARAWVLALGFTLAFGGMFSKTWRVHAIFTNIKLNRKVIKDYKLMLVVLVLVMIDVAILVGWQIVDPFQKAVKRLVPEVYDDYEVIPKLEFCSSRHMEIWLGSIYAYKGLLLAFGCFLAWETRHVSIPALNDSKYIGMSVYNVVIMCTCGAAVTFLIQDQPTHSFVIIAVFIIFATTATLCLVFVPKIIQLRRDPKGDDKRIRATLRKPSRRCSDDDTDRFQHKVRLTTEENRRLRGFLEQKAAEVDHLLEQLGEEPSGQDLSIKSALHKKVLELRTSDASPSKLSRVSMQSDAEVMSTFSDVSVATSTLYVSEMSPGRQLKSRMLNNRMFVESIEMSDIRGPKGRKPSLTIPPPAEEEDDDPFGGVYIGPPDPPPVRTPPENNPPNKCNNTACSDHPSHTGNVVTVATLYLDNGGSSGQNTQTSSEFDHHHNEASVMHSLQGLHSRLGVALARHSRAKRRHSAPGTIWTIAEAGEEEQPASREGRETEQPVDLAVQGEDSAETGKTASSEDVFDTVEAGAAADAYCHVTDVDGADSSLDRVQSTRNSVEQEDQQGSLDDRPGLSAPEHTAEQLVSGSSHLQEQKPAKRQGIMTAQQPVGGEDFFGQAVEEGAGDAIDAPKVNDAQHFVPEDCGPEKADRVLTIESPEQSLTEDLLSQKSDAAPEEKRSLRETTERNQHEGQQFTGAHEQLQTALQPVTTQHPLDDLTSTDLQTHASHEMQPQARSVSQPHPTEHTESPQDVMLIDVPLPSRGRSQPVSSTETPCRREAACLLTDSVSSSPSSHVFHRQMSLPDPLPYSASIPFSSRQNVVADGNACSSTPAAPSEQTSSGSSVNQDPDINLGESLELKPAGRVSPPSLTVQSEECPSDSPQAESAEPGAGDVTDVSCRTHVLVEESSKVSDVLSTCDLAQVFPEDSSKGTGVLSTGGLAEVFREDCSKDADVLSSSGPAQVFPEDSSNGAGFFGTSGSAQMFPEDCSKGAGVLSTSGLAQVFPEDCFKGAGVLSTGGSAQVFPEDCSKGTGVLSTSGLAQVFPESKVPSVEEAEEEKKSQAGSHCSDEELWASPTMLTSSPRTSSPRVTFVCDVIEKL